MKIDEVTVTKIAGELIIPNSIFIDMGQPSSLSIQKRPDSILLGVRRGLDVRILVKRLLCRSVHSTTARLRTKSDYQATFIDQNDLIPEGRYQLGNYHPIYQLFKVEAMSTSELAEERRRINARAWSTIIDYHEHLPISKQDREAHAISNLLSSTISMNAETPQTILELGCGSGRNLHHFSLAFPAAQIMGIDINTPATGLSEFGENVKVVRADVLSTDLAQLGRFDVVVTSGFLMHITHDDVDRLVREIAQIAELQVHFELHGTPHIWDFHRYPRSYDELFARAGLGYDDYRIFAGHPVYSYGLTNSFAHALLVRRRSSV